MIYTVSLQFDVQQFQTNMWIAVFFSSSFFLAIHYSLTHCLRLACEAVLQKNRDLHVALDSTNRVWLINETECNHRVSAGELFGFGVGSYQEAYPLIPTQDFSAKFQDPKKIQKHAGPKKLS